MSRRSALFLLLLTGCGTRTNNLVPKRLCAGTTLASEPGAELPDVADALGLLLNGDAAVVDGVLRLTSAQKNRASSAFLAEPMAFGPSSSFHAKFAFRVAGGPGELGADGMAFVLQSSEAGSSALGRGADGLGYRTITPSVVIEFDTASNEFDPSDDHIALTSNGNPEVHLAFAATLPMNDGVLRYVEIDYLAETRALDVYVSTSPERPASATLSYSALDFSAVLGEQVFVGFSASTGEGFNDHDLIGPASFSTAPPTECNE